MNNNKEKNSEKEENVENIIDNRISPLVNQGLIFEVNRIRNRELLDIIMKVGNKWRNKPIFYVVSIIDGLEYSSYEENGFTFNTWDSFFNDFRIIRDAEEEQEKSTVKLSIIEKEKNGFLRTKETIKEKINLIYDYRTGQWNGDDFFSDNDGYGHYVGKYYEIWFDIYQTDYNHDKIPYWTEVNLLNIDPYEDNSKLDPDGDGIPTAWEWKWGYNPKIWDDHTNLDPDIDGLNNIEEYQMAKWFANPFCQDIYIEVDRMEKGGIFDFNHVFYKESQEIMIERFCRHGISLYIDDGWPNGPINGGGDLLPYVKKISWDSGLITQFYNNYFADERKGIFRYMIIGHSGGLLDAWAGNTAFNKFDTIFYANSLKMTYIFERAFTPRTQRFLMASAILHELGHTLGIAPYTIEGNDNISFLIDSKTIRQLIKNFKYYIEEWGNYKSVMNYLYIFNKNLVDYSDGNNGYNDQNDWEKFYLPFFEIENNIICEPGILPPAVDKVVNKNMSIVINGWNFSEDLTKLYIKSINNFSPVDPIKCGWMVYIRNKNTSYRSDRDVRIYVKPLVPISGWSLIKECYLNEIFN